VSGGISVHTFALTPNGRTLAVLDQSGHVQLWSTFTGRLLLELEPRLARRHAIQFSPTGQHLVVAGLGISGHPELAVWQAPD
jgi:hypothetical protein